MPSLLLPSYHQLMDCCCWLLLLLAGEAVGLVVIFCACRRQAGFNLSCAGCMCAGCCKFLQFLQCSCLLVSPYYSCNTTCYFGCYVSVPAGVELDPTCPALGASVLDASTVGVDSNQVFSLPAYMLDAFGSLITRGPGSDWVLSLQLPDVLGTGRRTTPVFLSGASRGRLSDGASVLAGLSMGLPPDSNVTVALVGWPAAGSSAQVGSTLCALLLLDFCFAVQLL
jgi:hypothetical protein